MWQVIDMDLGDIISFIVGGLVSAVIFYPKKKRINSYFIASQYAYWWYAGMHFAQKNSELPPISENDILNWSVRPESLKQFNQSAINTIKILDG